MVSAGTSLFQQERGSWKDHQSKGRQEDVMGKNLYETHVLRTMCSNPDHINLQAELTALRSDLEAMTIMRDEAWEDRLELQQRLAEAEGLLRPLEDFNHLKYNYGHCPFCDRVNNYKPENLCHTDDCLVRKVGIFLTTTPTDKEAHKQYDITKIVESDGKVLHDSDNVLVRRDYLTFAMIQMENYLPEIMKTTDWFKAFKQIVEGAKP
jgi:hypothetical protein